MRKVLKWVGIVMGVLVGVVIAAAMLLYFLGGARLNKTRQVQPLAMNIHNDEEALARGEHLVKVACTSCHSDDLSGAPLLADPAIGTVYAANISGLGERRTDEELELAIRHGIGSGGRQLVIMPSDGFIHFSEQDLNAVIAYLKRVPRTGEDTPKPKLTPMGQIMLAAGLFGQIFPAEYIDHSQPFHEMPEISANLEYGEYLSRFCATCHGEDLSGKASADPSGPIAPNLTPGGGLASWTEADFIQTIRTGVTPHNYHLNPEYMPWKSFAKFDDNELQAIWMYLQSLPAKEMRFE
ncbi:MAG: c-type cytochrome [Anaerolineales bacterium]